MLNNHDYAAVAAGASMPDSFRILLMTCSSLQSINHGSSLVDAATKPFDHHRKPSNLKPKTLNP